jgi:hypothetical protein
MPYALGTPTVNKGFLKNEVQKLNQAFVVATGETFFSGMPTVLNAAGEAVPAGVGALRETIIGFALFGAKAGEEVTVTLKAFSIIFAEVVNALNPSMVVKYAGFNATTGFNKIDDTGADATNYIGKPLRAATTAGDIVEVALF